jgi:hypothetical protein
VSDAVREVVLTQYAGAQELECLDRRRLALAFLNEATQAWGEYEYNRKLHSETGEVPSRASSPGPR